MHNFAYNTRRLGTEVILFPVIFFHYKTHYQQEPFFRNSSMHTRLCVCVLDGSRVDEYHMSWKKAAKVS